jgi:hypothetical protein
MSDKTQSPFKKLISVASRVVGGLVSTGSPSPSPSNDNESSAPGLEQSSQSSASTVQQSGVQEAAVTLDESQMYHASAASASTVQQSGVQQAAVAVSAVSTSLDLNQCAGSLAASSLSSDGTLPLASKPKVTVPRNLLPILREGIDREWVIQHWSVVRQWISLGAYLPENEPEEKHVTAVLQELQGCYDYACRRLDENLRIHLQWLLWKHNLLASSGDNVPKSVKQIHILVLKSAK